MEGEGEGGVAGWIVEAVADVGTDGRMGEYRAVVDEGLAAHIIEKIVDVAFDVCGCGGTVGADQGTYVRGEDALFDEFGEDEVGV